MLVKLMRNWFGPDGVRYRSKDRTGYPFFQDIPSELTAELPSDAVVQTPAGEKTAAELRKAPAPAAAPKPAPKSKEELEAALTAANALPEKTPAEKAAKAKAVLAAEEALEALAE